MTLSRRHFLALAAAAAASGLVWGQFHSQGLKTIAAKKGVLFGATIHKSIFRNPVALELLKQEAAIVTPENEMKWRAIEPESGQFDFSEMATIEAFCAQENMKLRGHTLVWYKDAQRQDWLQEALASPEQARATQVMERHINATMAHYRGRLHSIDVVNEAINPKDGRADGLRKSPWLDVYGPDYISYAFKLAAHADPSACLVYNEHLLEYDTSYYEKRRKALLTLLDRLQAQNTPLHAVGIQSHLWADQPFNPTVLRTFLEEIRSRGLQVMITELDVNTSKISGSQAQIEQQLADHAEAYLEAAFSAAPIKTLICWGLKDNATWNGMSYVRADNKPPRLLPYTADGQKRPLYKAISRVLEQI